ncbi:MAG: NADH-quinone oxidoreductase subunit C [Oligoflexia bacterium]|nr:NADH-quinone oxidoreductase subunit C [Oligoflexia bacterium]
MLTLLGAKVGNLARDARIELGDVVISVERSQLKDLFQILRHDTQLAFDFFVSVTAVDWMDQRSERFELVYHLMSSAHLYRLRVKVCLPEEKPEIESAVALWPGADFMERECWDMYGIVFKGHPDLRRILMYEEFVGHPLRKDYPLQGKQPRIPLRAPEVQNTARDMLRPTLVQINRRAGAGSSPAGGASNSR